jgi:hypothetical protein
MPSAVSARGTINAGIRLLNATECYVMSVWFNFWIARHTASWIIRRKYCVVNLGLDFGSENREEMAV